MPLGHIVFLIYKFKKIILIQRKINIEPVNIFERSDIEITTFKVI